MHTKLRLLEKNAVVNLLPIIDIFLGSRKPISQHDLKAVTNDVTSAGNRTITFVIVTSPKLGRLIRVDSDDTIQEVFSFTQSMVSIYFITTS